MVKRKSRPQMLFTAATKVVVGMKIPRWQHRAGSIPAPGTILSSLIPSYFFLTTLTYGLLAKIRQGKFQSSLKHPVFHRHPTKRIIPQEVSNDDKTENVQ